MGKMVNLPKLASFLLGRDTQEGNPEIHELGTKRGQTYAPKLTLVSTFSIKNWGLLPPAPQALVRSNSPGAAIAGTSTG